MSFVADKPGRFEIVCATHHPTMVAELIGGGEEVGGRIGLCLGERPARPCGVMAPP